MLSAGHGDPHVTAVKLATAKYFCERVMRCAQKGSQSAVVARSAAEGHKENNQDLMTDKSTLLPILS